MQLGLDFYSSTRDSLSGGEAIEPPPQLGVSGHLYPFQVCGLERVDNCLKDYRSTLLVMPTGTGKTVVFTELVRRRHSERALILGHRDEILSQARERIGAATDELVGLEQAGFYGGTERIVVASVQSLSREGRLARWKPTDFDLIVVDEAHHAVSRSYRRILDYFSTAKVVGVTATPDRADELAMRNVFESVAFVYEIWDAIRDKYLCPVLSKKIRISSIDLSGVSTLAGDFNQGELDSAMAVEEALHGVADVTIREAGDRKTLLFTTSVPNVHRLCEILNRHRPGCSAEVDGETRLDVRRQTLSGFAEGRFQFLVNCGIATEGYDCPSISCVAMARPTKSRALFAQMVGRGLRLSPGKEDCLVLEFTGNTGRHQLACSADILGGKFSDEVMERAKKKLDSGGAGNVAKAIQESVEEEEKERLAAIARRAKLTATATYSVEEIDPFAVLHMVGQDDEWSKRFGGAVPTDKQMAALLKFGLDVPKNCTKQQANRLIGCCITRAQRKLATYKQVKLLARYGIPAVNVGFDRAARLISAVKDAGWKTPPSPVLRSILGK